MTGETGKTEKKKRPKKICVTVNVGEDLKNRILDVCHDRKKRNLNKAVQQELLKQIILDGLGKYEEQ